MKTASDSKTSLVPMNDPSYQMMLCLRTAYFSLRRKCNQLCQSRDCSGDQFVILAALYEQDGGVTQQFIAEQTGYDPVTAGTMLRTIQDRGWIIRDDHPTDKRAKLVSITTQGRRMFRKLWEDSLPLREEFAGSVSKRDWSTAFRILKSFSDATDSVETQ